MIDLCSEAICFKNVGLILMSVLEQTGEVKSEIWEHYHLKLFFVNIVI